MKKIIILAALLLGVITTSSAQTVETIRKDYNEAKSLQNSEIPKNNYQVVINKMYGGSGPHKEVVTMIPHVDYDDENNPGVPIFTPYLITSKFNWGAREYYQEFLFSDKGQVEFIYAKGVDENDFSEIEYRFYLNSSSVIKLIVNRKNANDNKFTQEYSGTSVTPKYKNDYDQYINNASSLLKLFQSINQYN